MNKFRQENDGEITLDILKESSNMVIPVATSSKEKISSLEQWARSRALFANQGASIDIDENIELENIDFGLGE